MALSVHLPSGVRPRMRLSPHWWPAPASDIVWKTTPVGTLTPPRGDLGAACVGHKIYVFGGDAPPGGPDQLLTVVESFDTQTYQFDPPPLALPQALSGPAVIGTPSGSIFICGGEAVNGMASGVCYEFVPPGYWRTRATMPHAAYCAAWAPGVGNTVCVIGGLRGATTLGFIQCFDPSIQPNGSWTQGPAPNVLRFDAAAAAAGGKIYIFGGLDDAGDLVGVVEEYDPATKTCKVLSEAMLTPRYDLTAVTGSNGRIYAIGGMRHCSATDIVEEFDPATQHWRAMTPMPTARYGAAAAATADGRIFVLGGWQKISGTVTATAVIEEGTLPTG